MAHTFNIFVEPDEDSGYIGKFPELRGCLSQGDTLNELIDNIKEAIELCLEIRKESTYAS